MSLNYRQSFLPLAPLLLPRLLRSYPSPLTLAWAQAPSISQASSQVQFSQVQPKFPTTRSPLPSVHPQVPSHSPASSPPTSAYPKPPLSAMLASLFLRPSHKSPLLAMPAQLLSLQLSHKSPLWLACPKQLSGGERKIHIARREKRTSVNTMDGQ